jgi:inward rectifier potassium channel
MPKTRLSPKIRHTGAEVFRRQFYYHKLLDMPTPAFLVLLLAIFALVNCLFAGLYYVCHGLISLINPGASVRLVDALYFSMTFPVVGYGGIAPQGIGKLLSAIHVFAVMVFLATMTGMIFSRFSQAKSPLLWSSPVVFNKDGRQQYLQVRVTNILGNDVVNVTPKLFLQKNEYSKTGEIIRRLTPIPLETTNIPIAAFSWIISHKITANSPLKHWITGNAKSEERLLGFILGLDSTIGRSIYSFTKWSPKDLVAGHFENIITNYSENEDLRSRLDIDLSKIDSVIR